jgi:Spy/CpxP family protein refolding chaperone
MTLRFKRLSLIVAAATLVLGLANSWASAQNTNGGGPPFSGAPGPGRGPGGRGGSGGPMGILEPLRMAASQIGLSDAQKEQIKAIAQSHADEWKGLADRERQGRQALRAAVSAPQFDEVTIRQRSAELGAVEADVAVAQARARAEAIQVLTADQRAKLKEIESQFPQGRGRRG